ncbi:hypothetical protein C8261_12180 [Pseudothauera lacus]|uniref:Multidrug transporter n=1 Tax=Pseudothauera lacus TaxID=2136175 RepID=A0A2T4IDM4_9RHOO|nr:hypothetical protein C8261_12180 [Pseudothauera lacus]
MAITALCACLTVGAPGVRAQHDEAVTGDRATDMAVDLVVVRPLGLLGAVVGGAGFLIALPFTLPTGTAGQTAREWVGAPLEYTFNRPLGDFRHCGAERRPCGAGR